METEIRLVLPGGGGMESGCFMGLDVLLGDEEAVLLERGGCDATLGMH